MNKSEHEIKIQELQWCLDIMLSPEYLEEHPELDIKKDYIRVYEAIQAVLESESAGRVE